MSEPISVVIDKSYLQGCTISQLKEITKNHRILVTAELSDEIFTAEDEILKKCFRNLLTFSNFIDLIDHLGTLLKVEIEKQISCSPIQNYFRQGELNSKFNFKFTNGQIKHIKDFKDDIEISGAKEFDKIVLEIRNVIPTLKIRDVRNLEKIRTIYARFRSDNLPPAEKIDERWAIFRRLQVDLIAAIEYLQNFKNGKFNITQTRKEHNQIDFRICVFALLT